MKGYADLTNVCLTNRKFKKFKYDGELKENPCNEFELKIKVNALNFFKVIEYLNKNKAGSLNLKIENRRLVISSNFDVVKTEISIDY